MSDTIDVLIADDNRRVRQHIRTLLETAVDITVVGEAESGADAVNQVQTLQPNIVIIDITMPEMDGFQATEKIKSLKTPAQVIVLTIHTSSYFVRRALEIGARGYVLKQAAAKELLVAIRTVMQGELYVSNSLTA